MKLNSGFRVSDIKDLQTVLPILVIKTSKQAAKATAFFLCWTLCSQISSTVVSFFAHRKGNDNLSELIPVLKKKMSLKFEKFRGANWFKIYF